MVDNNHAKVFNVRQDPGERRDLTSSRPDIARQLNQLLAAWVMDVNAEQVSNEPQEGARIQQLLGGRQGGAAPAGGRGQNIARR